jgi:transcriptional regulator with XRE-family HTH domain
MRIRSVREFLGAVMEERGWSGAQLGRELEISQQYVSFILTGRKDPIPSWLRHGADRVGYEIRFVPKQEEDPVKRREAIVAMSVAFVPAPRLGPYHDPAFLRKAGIALANTRRERGGLAALPIASRHYQHIRSIIKADDRKLQVLNRWHLPGTSSEIMPRWRAEVIEV